MASITSKAGAGREVFYGRQKGWGRWQQLTADRQGFITRIEKYAAQTIPKVMLPDYTDQNSESIQHAWTSVGAQAVNHLTNKLMLTLFRPGAPFFRLDLPRKDLANLMRRTGLDEKMVRAILVVGEQDAMRVLDQKALRPKLYEIVRALIVTGNSLLDLTNGDIRAIGLRNYTVKRSITGQVIEILIHEQVLFDELTDEVRVGVSQKQPDAYVHYVRHYTRRGGKWRMTQHVDNEQLGSSFDQTYTDKTLPLHVLTWDLADGQDYGTGLVEDYAGDFGTLDTLSEAELKMALLVSDYRWLAAPAGMTDIEAFKTTHTGDVISGQEGDLALVSASSTGASLQYVSATVDRVIRRIGQAFLLGSAITRDAERVTAEEIRMQAEELETSLGGVYSRLAILLQLPLVTYLVTEAGVQVKGTPIVPTIITGLEALSRNVEAQQLALFLQDLAGLQALGELLGWLKLDEVISTLAAARGINPDTYVKTAEQVAAERQAAQQQQVEAEAQAAVANEGAKAAAQEGSA